MKIRKATIHDCRSIAELALIAGEGIPAYFWEQSRQVGQEPIEVGIHNAASETDNFSYRNTYVAEVMGSVVGMILGYRLPDEDAAEDMEDFPEFIRPLIELEQCVPGSFYINMLATCAEYRNQGIGTKLMAIVDDLAEQAGSSLISIEVFDQNEGALGLYQRLGFSVVETRPIIPHSSHPYDGNIVLLTRPRNTR